jgi:hypothetical protein
MELPHHLVQIARQARDRLRADHFSGERGHHPAYLPRADSTQKRLPDQQRNIGGASLEFIQSFGKKGACASARSAASVCPNALRNPAGKIHSVFPGLLQRPFLPGRPAKPVPLSHRIGLQKLFPSQSRLAVQISPQALLKIHLC